MSAAKRNMNQTEQVSGTIQKQLFRDASSGFTIFLLEQDSGEQVTVHGTLARFDLGQPASCKGRWFIHKRHGSQFKAKTIDLSTPANSRGIQSFLASSRFHGIGKHFAKKLADKFGDRLMEVIENNPLQLEAIDGFGPKKRTQLVNAWRAYNKENAAELEIQTFLRGLGLGDTRCTRIYAKYGADTRAKIQSNPYILIRDFDGIGFATADAVARSIGVAQNSRLRIRACIEDYLKRQSMERGDTAKLRVSLLSDSARQLGISEDEVCPTLSDMIDKRLLINETSFGGSFVYLPHLHRSETGIAERLNFLKSGASPWQFNPVDEMDQAQSAVSFPLADSQKACIRTVLSNKVSCVTGGPGVGKTSILSAALSVMDKYRLRYLLCSPTGKAAERMSEASCRPASTVHRLLEYDGRTRKFRHNRKNPLDCDVIVIDELSMLDVPTAFALLESIPSHAAVILIGDPDQLPSVGVGAVLDDIIKSKAIAVGRLTEVFRQGPGSGIILAARSILSGEVPWEYVDTKGGDFRVMMIDDKVQDRAQAIADCFYDQVFERLPAEGFLSEDITALSVKREGTVGTYALNEAMQHHFNADMTAHIEQGRFKLGVGDPVIQLKNCYSKLVWNGSVGTIVSINTKTRSLVVDFGGRKVKYEKRDINQLQLSYCGTVHRSQGSEYPVVVTVVAPEHYTLADRRLVNTAITRAQKVSVLITTRKTIKGVLNNMRSYERTSLLAERLQA